MEFIKAAEARNRTQNVREDQMKVEMRKISERVEKAIVKGEFETYVDFSLALKVEMIKLLEESGYKMVSAGNVTHAGRYQIKISWQ